MVAAPINHIVLDERGVAYIAGTRIKVRHIVIERNAWNKSPEQIHEEYPRLSLGQIYAALVVAAGTLRHQLRRAPRSCASRCQRLSGCGSVLV